MSGLFSRARKPDVIEAPEPVEQVSVVEEEAEEVRKRERKRLLTGGRRGTILSGIASALKRRLGE